MKLELVTERYTQKQQRQWRMVRMFEWIADVHLMVYPLLVVAFFLWIAYGSR